MGLIAWLFDKDDAGPTDDDRWEPARDIRVSDIQPSHDVEPGRRVNPKYKDKPVLVTRKLGGGYRVFDGNARLRDAQAGGRTHIRGQVRK